MACCEECKKIKRDAKKLREHLKALTELVMQYLVLLDDEMKKHESADRGKRIAQMSNALEMANDKARYFGLGIDFRNDDKNRSCIGKTEPTNEAAR